MKPSSSKNILTIEKQIRDLSKRVEYLESTSVTFHDLTDED